jgi:beta-galactosidase
VGVDEIRLIPARDADFAVRVRPLTSIGALVAYPHGSGGILLCQLRFAEDDDQPTVERKRRILKGLLENLGAELGDPGSGMSAPVVAATGVGEPLDLGAGDQRAPRWLGDERHSFSYPAGEVSLRGLRFRLAAPLRVGETRAIAVGRAADSLVFLHAAAVPDGDDGRLLARYRVVYADGRTVEVPVVAGRDIADCRQRSARPLARASLAWLGAPDADALAVVYARQWDNPTPAVTITRIELVGDDPASVVALLAATVLPPHAR